MLEHAVIDVHLALLLVLRSSDEIPSESGMGTPRPKLFVTPCTSGGSSVSTFALCFTGQALWPAEANSFRQDPRQISTSSRSIAPSPRAATSADAGPLPADPAAHHQ